MILPFLLVQDLPQLEGVWEARKVMGPALSGRLTISDRGADLRAEIGGVGALSRRGRFAFEFGEGSFRGHIAKDGTLSGHWIQPRGMVLGSAMATPLTLSPQAKGIWVGRVNPIPDALKVYLVLRKGPSGTLRAHLRNPDRNIGIFLQAETLEVDSGRVQLMGKLRGQKEILSLGQGTYDEQNETISLYFPSGGMSFDFTRASLASDFYPRAKPAQGRLAPPKLDDGWDVSSPKGVGLSEERLNHFQRELIGIKDESVHSLNVHGVLLARKGKLVFEEYFHGYSRDSLHDLRSASKSITSILVGSAMDESKKLTLNSPALDFFPSFAPRDDSARTRITIQSLLTMSSGLDCDDSNPESKGNEDVMQGQRKLTDYIRFTLGLPMVREPSARAVYGSAQANLLGGIISADRREWLPDFFRRRLANPLGIEEYAFAVAPNGEAYAGGGMYLKPRDFLKVGQLMLDKGAWKNRRIISKSYATQSIKPRFELAGIHYGFLWWIIRYPFEGRTIEAYFAGGNGGQLLAVVPELSIVFSCLAGNYSDPVMYVPQREWMPKYILPMVESVRK